MNIKTKRIIAYFLDALLITVISSLFTSNKYTNPYLDNHEKVYQEYQEVLQKYEDKVITKTEYLEKYDTYNYQLNRYNIYVTGIQIVCLILYFGLFQMVNNDQTLGKKIMKIKIVNAKTPNKKLNFGNYIIRILVLNGIFINIISIIFLYSSNVKIYARASYILYILNLVIEAIIIAMIFFREDGRGLHDILANTKVIEVCEE